VLLTGLAITVAALVSLEGGWRSNNWFRQPIQTHDLGSYLPVAYVISFVAIEI
jgi:hypothetical protein